MFHGGLLKVDERWQRERGKFRELVNVYGEGWEAKGTLQLEYFFIPPTDTLPKTVNNTYPPITIYKYKHLSLVFTPFNFSFPYHSEIFGREVIHRLAQGVNFAYMLSCFFFFFFSFGKLQFILRWTRCGSV